MEQAYRREQAKSAAADQAIIDRFEKKMAATDAKLGIPRGNQVSPGLLENMRRRGLLPEATEEAINAARAASTESDLPEIRG